MKLNDTFAKAANTVAHATGRPMTFALCCMLVVAWALSGPFFHFSDTWQLVINTGTTIVTFLMVFLIQNTQNRESEALHGKLDEIIRSIDRAENRYMGLERRSESEIAEMRADCEGEHRATGQGGRAARMAASV